MSSIPEDFDDAYQEDSGPFARFFDSFNGLQPIADLLLRLTVAWAFYASGITRVVSEPLANAFGLNVSYPTSLTPTESTLTLYANEYHVPFLTPELAAQIGTAAEIVLPVLIVLGLFGRLGALGLFIFNIVAVVSYPAGMWAADGSPTPGLYLHLLWGLMLLIIVAHGPGKISIDHLVRKAVSS
ncbi:MAG: DoxX family protein [Gammaproteobacteria bacterium]